MAAYYYEMLPMQQEEQPDSQSSWVVNILFVQAAVMFILFIMVFIWWALEEDDHDQQLKRVVERLDALEQEELPPVLEITHETPAAGARGRAARIISHLRIHRNPHARAD